jgi:hypothetical protein
MNMAYTHSTQHVFIYCTQSTEHMLLQCTQSTEHVLLQCRQSTEHVLLQCTQSTEHVLLQCTESTRRQSLGHNCISNAHTTWCISHLQSGQSMEHIAFPIHKEHGLTTILQCTRSMKHIASPIQSTDRTSSPICTEHGTYRTSNPHRELCMLHS